MTKVYLRHSTINPKDYIIDVAPENKTGEYTLMSFESHTSSSMILYHFMKKCFSLRYDHGHKSVKGIIDCDISNEFSVVTKSEFIIK